MNQKEFIGQQIKKFRLEKPDLSAAKLGAMLSPKKDGSTIYSWENGRTQPGGDDLIQLCVIFGKEIEDFFFKSEKYYEAVLSDESADPYVELPIFGEIAAGVPIEMLPVDSTNPCPKELLEPGHVYGWLRVNGNSYTKGGINNGMLALVDFSDREYVPDKPFAVCVNGDSATIKAIEPKANGIELIPNSYDPTYRPMVFDYNEDDTEEVTIMGRIKTATYPVDWSFDSSHYRNFFGVIFVVIKNHRSICGIELIPNSYDPTYRPMVFDYNEDDTEEVTIMGRIKTATYPVDWSF